MKERGEREWEEKEQLTLIILFTCFGYFEGAEQDGAGREGKGREKKELPF